MNIEQTKQYVLVLSSQLLFNIQGHLRSLLKCLLTIVLAFTERSSPAYSAIGKGKNEEIEQDILRIRARLRSSM